MATAEVSAISQLPSDGGALKDELLAVWLGGVGIFVDSGWGFAGRFCNGFFKKYKYFRRRSSPITAVHTNGCRPAALCGSGPSQPTHTHLLVTSLGFAERNCRGYCRLRKKSGIHSPTDFVGCAAERGGRRTRRTLFYLLLSLLEERRTRISCPEDKK